MPTGLEANSITSLGLWCPAEDSWRVPPNTLTDHEDIMPSALYKLFGIPSLRQITISHLFDGDETDVQMPFAHHDPLSFYQMDNWSGSSGVTSVSLPSATYSYATLGAVVAIAAWPKRLEKVSQNFPFIWHLVQDWGFKDSCRVLKCFLESHANSIQSFI